MKILDLIKQACDDYPMTFDWDVLKDLKEEDIPQPALWKLLVLPAMPKTKIGSILLTNDVQEAETYNNSRSLVLAVGPLAYSDTDRFKAHPEASKTIQGCKPGDYVAHGKYSGQKLTLGEVTVMLLNDDEITATIPNPAALAAYI